MSKHDFTLVENALDSLEHAIDHLSQSVNLSKGDYKRVILDLSHVAELLFKERLLRIHPAFVLSDVDKYPSKTAHSVGAEHALKRLIKIGNVEFRSEDESALKTIREKRNEIEHFEFTINEKESRIVIGSVLVFLFRFALDELSLDWASRRIEDPAWAKLNEFTEFFESQKSSVLAQLEGSGIPIHDCPACRNETFDIDGEVCVLCGHRENVLSCKQCRNGFLISDIEHDEPALCPKCEWLEGYTMANSERY